MTGFFVITMIGLQLASLIVMGANILEFRHIHKKRIELMRSLGCPRIRVELLQRRLLIALYVCVTVAIIALTSIAFLQLLP